MSVDISWDTLTGGPDGESLARAIQAFIHDKFQKVPLPRMIRSVNVQSFEFGSTPPSIVLKDVCDPLPDFYEDDQDDDTNANDDVETPETAETTRLGQDASSYSRHSMHDVHGPSTRPHRHEENTSAAAATPRPLTLRTDNIDRHQHRPHHITNDGIPPRSQTPRLVGSMSNLGYFHLPLSAGLSGTSTPLAAVAGARYPYWPEHDNHQHTATSDHHRTTSFGSVTPPSTLTSTSRPTSRHTGEWQSSHSDRSHSDINMDGSSSPLYQSGRPVIDKSPEDMQVVAHISYNGDVRLTITAEILLDYPMPSFVGIPIQLNITGLKFDGIGILAYIKKKAHFCFLAPEDAEAMVGDGNVEGHEHSTGDSPNPSGSQKGKPGGLIEEIRVESEIGQKEGGKQVLKNVGKVEKFILEQVRRIFEDEFVYPSFWTFLV